MSPKFCRNLSSPPFPAKQNKQIRNNKLTIRVSELLTYFRLSSSSFESSRARARARPLRGWTLLRSSSLLSPSPSPSSPTSTKAPCTCLEGRRGRSGQGCPSRCRCGWQSTSGAGASAGDKGESKSSAHIIVARYPFFKAEECLKSQRDSWISLGMRVPR